MLAKYVRRHHRVDKIIGDRSSGVMIRNKLKNPTCLPCAFEPKIVKDTLDNEDWIHTMDEEIEHIKKSKIWSLVLRPKDKNVIGTKLSVQK